MLNSDKVYGKHFVSRKPAPYWHDVDWVPTLQLSKKNYRLKLGHDAYEEKIERAKEQEQVRRNEGFENSCLET